MKTIEERAKEWAEKLYNAYVLQRPIGPYLKDMLEEHTSELTRFGVQDCPVSEDQIEWAKKANAFTQVKCVDDLLKIIDHQRSRIAALEGLLSDAGKDSNNFRAYSVLMKVVIRAFNLMHDGLYNRDYVGIDKFSQKMGDAYNVLKDCIDELVRTNAPEPAATENTMSQ